ncbi:unnamed protein product [Didymodactylos carnosus]|uniref:Uncharacterized protein n=1 Tax=Didymodactylos carnosus TaxID=1234261 RepID=A0A815R1M1_9BILA|nr:unnamed protein product [Didymodactylos carnosus]CAF4338613.1 unnamed protein product [Didymodactylos carnosus]
MAAARDPYIEELRDLVSCSICLDHYEDPRILPCSHTFCFKCIQQCALNNGSFQCPFRDDSTVNTRDIYQLPINRAAKDMVELASKMSMFSLNPEQQQVKCDNCDQQRAVHWCEKCSSHYCDSCTKSVHSIKTLQSHSVVPLAEKASVFCTEHSDEKIKYWCARCQLPVCRDCLLFKHKDHQCISIQDAATRAKTELQVVLQDIDKREQQLGLELFEVNGIIEQQHATYRRAHSEIKKRFYAQHRSLEEEEKCIKKK